jgi:hypothetical protein
VLPEPFSQDQLDPAHLLGDDVANDEKKGHQAAQDREECHKEQEHLKGLNRRWEIRNNRKFKKLTRISGVHKKQEKLDNQTHYRNIRNN